MNANQKIAEIIRDQREELITLTDRSVLRQLFEELQSVGPIGVKCVDCQRISSDDALTNPNLPSSDRARLKSLVGKLRDMVEGAEDKKPRNVFGGMV